MSLLELERVSRAVGQGSHRRVILHDVSLQLDRGELLAVWGVRGSGRSTLLRVAAGIEPADGGVVRFAGRPHPARRGELLGAGIGYCRPGARGVEAHDVLEELMVGQLASGLPRAVSRARALAALERTGTESCASRALRELEGAEAVRVAIAGALVLAPSLLLIDDPTKGVDLLERDAILALLRALADDGIAVLISTGDATALSGADRALSLAGGMLRGSVAPELAPVVSLRLRASAC